jgi:hypothetical protein
MQVPKSVLALDHGLTQTLASFLQQIQARYLAENIGVRTKRLNLDSLADDSDDNSLLSLVDKVDHLCAHCDLRWFNLPFDLVAVKERELVNIENVSLAILKKFPQAFLNYIVADADRINMKAGAMVGNFILKVSKLDGTGFQNFRVGVSANIQPNAPFFPFTVAGDELGFSLALELVPEIFDLLRNDKPLVEIRADILSRLVPQIKLIGDIARQTAENSNLKFFGLDPSLAPYPEKRGSVAELFSRLGVDACGSNGTLFLTSFLTDILKTLIKESGVPGVGFGGVMYSLLEDEYLSKANNQKLLSVDSLISYAALCGCGLDMVPVPGTIFAEEINSIVLDVSAQALRLNKPLGVRILPIPLKQANEFTAFNMDFLYNTRILPVKNNILDRSVDDYFSYLTKLSGANHYEPSK